MIIVADFGAHLRRGITFSERLVTFRQWWLIAAGSRVREEIFPTKNFRRVIRARAHISAHSSFEIALTSGLRTIYRRAKPSVGYLFARFRSLHSFGSLASPPVRLFVRPYGNELAMGFC